MRASSASRSKGGSGPTWIVTSTSDDGRGRGWRVVVADRERACVADGEERAVGRPGERWMHAEVPAGDLDAVGGERDLESAVDERAVGDEDPRVRAAPARQRCARRPCPRCTSARRRRRGTTPSPRSSRLVRTARQASRSRAGSANVATMRKPPAMFGPATSCTLSPGEVPEARPERGPRNVHVRDAVHRAVVEREHLIAARRPRTSGRRGRRGVPARRRRGRAIRSDRCGCRRAPRCRSRSRGCR